MRAITIEHAAAAGPVAPQVRVVEDWPDPGPPRPGEIEVRTLATALNHMDLWVGMGIPGVEIQYPHVGGVDGCGEVVSIGEGVDAAWLGRRVVHNAAVVIPRAAQPGAPSAATEAPLLELIGEHSPGTHRDRYCVPAENACDVGTSDPVEAAAIGLTALTAYSMMVTKGALRPGQTVLITGIGGGVATAALAIARWMGCRILVTSRHEAKLARALALGAHCGLLDDGSDWSRRVREETGRRGVDMVVDTVGAHLLEPALRSLARGGAYVTAGTTAGPRAEAELNRVFWSQLRILGSTMGSNDEFREVIALFRAGHLTPEIDRVLPVSEARVAWEHLEAQSQMGKIVIDWTDRGGIA